jgi:predicted Fe-Mo cluster-binding NifX family protein
MRPNCSSFRHWNGRPKPRKQFRFRSLGAFSAFLTACGTPFVPSLTENVERLQDVAAFPRSGGVEEMILAVPVYQKRVSPLFDVASRIRIIECRNAGRAERGTVLLEGMTDAQRVTVLKGIGVQCVVCAGISGSCSWMLRSAGIQVVDGVVGDVDDVVDAYQGGRVMDESFRMPGWGGRWRHRKGYGRGWGGGRGRGGPR